MERVRERTTVGGPARAVPRLRPGDLVGVAAPASPVARRELEAALAGVRRLGLRAVHRDDLFDRHLYLARDDATRAAEITDFFLDPAVKGILCACPGYGSLRILPLLPWERISEHPKAFMGFSDVTVLLAALTARCRFVTFHGPTLLSGFLPGELVRSSWTALRRVLFEGDAPLEFPLPRAKVVGPRRTVAGTLVGGNLEMLTALLGTPWAPVTEGAVLFLEEVGAGEESLDQRLTQLRLSGKFDGVAAVLFGDMNLNQLSPPYRVEHVIENVLGDMEIPVLIGFPAGHGRRNAPLVVGGRYSVSTETKTVTLLEPGVHLP